MKRKTAWGSYRLSPKFTDALSSETNSKGIENGNNKDAGFSRGTHEEHPERRYSLKPE
jgi:hypothetical protein